MERSHYARLAVIATVALCGGWASAAPRMPHDVDALMAHVGERVAEYSRRARNVICVERSTVQPIQSNWSADGMARTVESELRVEFDGAGGDAPPEAKMIRDVRRVNGRAPRERDKTDRSGCTDPNPLSPEPLAFLLPGQRADYLFTKVVEGKEKDRAALVVDFMSASRTSKPELIEDPRGHHDCFDWTGPIATRGRVWVDAVTHDVLRVERYLHGPVDVRVPWALQRRYNFAPWITLERDDVTMRYKAVTFSDPDEAILLPASIDSVTILRGTLQSMRRTDMFTDYRRFLTTTRVKDPR